MEEQGKTKPELETAILAAVDTGEYDADSSLDELEELARTAGAEVIGRLFKSGRARTLPLVSEQVVWRSSPSSPPTRRAISSFLTGSSPRPSSAIWKTPFPAGWLTAPS